MANNDYVPVSWNGEAITNDKLNQMCNNDQYLFDRAPKMRYVATGITRDLQLKQIAGITPQPPSTTDFVDINIYFGSFFTTGSHPSVVCTYEGASSWLARFVSIRGFNGEIDHTGFIARVYSREAAGNKNNLAEGGWVHWTATGY